MTSIEDIQMLRNFGHQVRLLFTAPDRTGIGYIAPQNPLARWGLRLWKRGEGGDVKPRGRTVEGGRAQGEGKGKGKRKGRGVVYGPVSSFLQHLNNQ